MLGRLLTRPAEATPPVPRFPKILAAIVGVVAVVALTTFIVMRQAAKSWPPAYETAVRATEEADTPTLDAGKQTVESHAAAFYSDAQTADTWAIELPLSDLNAWLATRLVDEMESLDSDASVDLYQPRVWTAGDLLMLSAQTVVGPMEGVLTVGVKPTVTDRGEIALEFADTRVGSLPVPPTGVAEHIRRSFVGATVPLRWAGGETKTVAMLDPGRLPIAKDRAWRFTALELTDEALRVACEAEQIDEPPANDADAGE